MRFDWRPERDGLLLLDGAMGTVLQADGGRMSGNPALLSLTAPERIEAVHRAYLDAGSRVIYANTFGANGPKLKRSGYGVAEAVAASVRIARRAAEGSGAFVALDIGPLGELLEPMGTLPFETAYARFAEVVAAGRDAGADLCVIETMTDLFEAKAALLAVKEQSGLPVFVTMSFEENGRTFTGCTIPSMAHTLEGLGADAIGLNCSVGPKHMAALIGALAAHTRLPILAKPNAGLPSPTDGRYSMTAAQFAQAAALCVEAGAAAVGGCCGSTPQHIRALAEAIAGKKCVRRAYHPVSFVCTPTQPCPIDGVRVIGERINPTGKKRLQAALHDRELGYPVQLALAQQQSGADILDVNVGEAGVDEAALLPLVVQKIQSVVPLPLQLDSADPAALEAALRVYNGKAAVNSVSGEAAVLARILPIVKKYGAAVIGLTVDENGVPQSAEARVAIAERILAAALAHGIPKEDVWIDCLTLTASAEQAQVRETLRAVHAVRGRLGLQTVLGVSNVSFGLPCRTQLTQTFLVQALGAGLTLPILNPNQREMMDAVAACRVLSGEDERCNAYLARFGAVRSPIPAAGEMTLSEAVMRGLAAEASRLAGERLRAGDGSALVETVLIPALERVGQDYEAGTLFLPQLLAAAQAAQAVFEVLRTALAAQGADRADRGTVLVATVAGDIHDIGKNIAKTVLENYGYRVVDLGRDVAPEAIVRAAAESGARLVGLSALMTTTLPSMAETVRLLKGMEEPPAVMVGGAVVTAAYAASIGADYYAKDARRSVRIAQEVLG